MDALIVDKGDPWNPDPATIERSHRMCAEVSRVLAPGGVFVQLSFEQVHFRRKFLLGEHVVHAAAESPSKSEAAATAAVAPAADFDRGSIPQDSEVALSRLGGGGGMYDWDMQVHDVQGESGCFGQFLYVLRKRRGEGVAEGAEQGRVFTP